METWEHLHGGRSLLFVDMEPATYIPNDYLLSLRYFFALDIAILILPSASMSAC